MSAGTRRFYAGEDIALTARYTDPDTDTAVDPDDTGTDAIPDATITIRGPDGTALVTDAAMTHIEAGRFEYVWDTALNGVGPGEYSVGVRATFGGETKILGFHPELRESPA